MPDERTVTLMGRRAGELLAGLSGIVDDLWPAPAPAAGPAPTATPAAGQAQAPASAFPPFEKLWAVADETVDWTDALARETPDGLTDPAQWALYRRWAAPVLAGDIDAYLTVIEAMQPLDDLRAYAASFDIAAPNADELRADMQALPCYLVGAGDEIRRYAAGMAVRVARDLFALLPVTRVHVDVRSGQRTLLSVTFEKAEMLKVRFAFIDPVAFATRCGGVFP